MAECQGSHTADRGLRPCLPALLDHPEFMGPLGLKILAVIVCGTVTVMVVTALFIELCYRWRTANTDISETRGGHFVRPINIAQIDHERGG